MRGKAAGIVFIAATLLLASGAWATQLSYADSITALAYGNVASEGKVPPKLPLDELSRGEVWLNVTGFAPDKLPHIQRDVGIVSFDNAVPLQIIAGLAKTAAAKGQWGDLVFLYNVFSMNAVPEYAKVSSNQMQYGLWKAVTGGMKAGVDAALVKLYADTSSSVYLSAAFRDLLKSEETEEATMPMIPTSALYTSYFCDSAHRAITSACQSLVQAISVSVTVKSGGPRNLCFDGCCISWSANATFQYQNLTEAANYCLNACATATVSCEVRGVSLQGTILDQCLSNRADGCT